MTFGRLTWRERGQLWLRLGIRLALTALALWLVSRFGRTLLSLFAPFLCALAAAALLNPLVRRAQRKLGLSRQFLTLFLLLVLFGLAGAVLVFLFYAAGQELMDLTRNWEILLASFQAAMDQLEVLFAQLLALVPPQITAAAQSAGEDLLTWLGQVVPDALTALASRAGQKAMGLPSFFIALLMFLMATYFLTADYPYLRSKAAGFLDESALDLWNQVRRTALGAFGGYLKAQIMLSAGVFVILLVGFTFTRQAYALLLALGLAILDFIPLLGAGTVMVPWSLIAFFTRDYPTAIEVMVIWGVIAVYRRVMEPKFVGDQTGLSPLLSLISIYVGMKVAGVAGMILAPIFVLVMLNLAGMGMFRGLKLDLTAAVRDLATILSQRPQAR